MIRRSKNFSSGGRPAFLVEGHQRRSTQIMGRWNGGGKSFL
jgi:hypothetical protein